MSSYESGVNVQIGSGASVMAVGRFLLPDGTPLSLGAGKVTAKSDSGIEETVFTNKTGRFAAQGLKPGTYHVLMRDPKMNQYTTELVIPEETVGYYKFEDITLREGEKS
jgi:outer membrane usher protein